MKILLTCVVAFAFATAAGAQDELKTNKQNEGNGIWIAVVPTGHEIGIEPLAAHRKKQGWEVEVVKRDEVAKENAHVGRWIRDYLQGRTEKAAKPVVAVLVGIPMAGEGDKQDFVIPGIEGDFLRMKGLPTDSGYSLKNSKPLAGLSVGRLPARTPEELKAMIGKIIKFESEGGVERWKTRLTVIAGSSNGGLLGDSLVLQQLGKRLKTVPGRWTMEQVADLSGSLFTVPEQELRNQTRTLLERGQMFSFYLGHAYPGGMSSEGVPFFDRDDFSSLSTKAGAGVFLTCGCRTLAFDVPGEEGHGFAAMRNPAGPAAFIGAEFRSRAALGLLALDGMAKVISKPDLKSLTLADCWQGVFNGIDSGGIHPAIFMLMDRGDGTGGKVPLEDQRREHLQMWMMLGDPAMRLPLIPAGLALSSEPVEAHAGSPLKISGNLPEGWDSGKVRVVVERPSTSKPIVEDQSANQFVIATTNSIIKSAKFEVEIELPEILPVEKIIVRAVAEAGGKNVLGFLDVPIKAGEPVERSERDRGEQP